ncbi:MAG: ATP-dependent helicase/nuclease subunit [Alphaproteobacteria bacterium]|jgi:ATP-dependent helicase/nuclease subunit A|nr:ATP-dependent helicase/nuclease subunit [Alphaproteobacteria bacterium]
MTTRTIPDHVRALQIAASDPDTSAWVAANAGSGKTHVLAQRVVRLLLDGVDPAKILCITFTKAAAANMANRVFGMLAEWTALDDKQLDKAVAEIAGKKPDAERRSRARRLFALALETPGGLKVQTIHAFCTRLLHQFPFEANVAARFSVLDESANAQLLDRLTLDVLLAAATAPDGPLGRALAKAITTAADQTFKEAVSDAIRQRDLVTAWIERTGSVDAAIAELSESLGISPAETSETIEAEFFDATLIDPDEWPEVATALTAGSKNDHKQVERIVAVQAAPEVTRLDAYLSIFCTAELEPRKNIVTKGIEAAHPQLFQRLLAEQERVCALLTKRRAVIARDRTASLLTIADAVLSRYRAEKDRRGLLNYDDLIDHTLALFENVSAAWVLYKLDLGIDHVLIDEAQDTSPKQWEIIRKIVAEFAAGAGARAIKRTVFAVGDDKQSIFSFQGAAPQQFAEMKVQFRNRFSAAELGWKELRFESSFRSGAAVLGAVDDVFARPEVYAGLSADPVQTVHQSLPDAAPGAVEIWPLFKPDRARDIEGWDAPFDEVTETNPQVRLAAKIARTIGIWTQRGRKPGDVLILVRQRGALFEAIIRALKNASIPVAGADRLVLTDHIAVMDLIVLADALLLPGDDLALATMLRSPLFGFTDEQLFRVAWDRKTSLRAALIANAGEDTLFAEAAARLNRFTRAAAHETPFSFYARLLGAEGGRKQFLARLGHEAADALDEFLNLALDYESRETPSLQGFVAWLRGAKTEVKRDMEITRDEVRVMTVHGAKGLEAPIVILADTTTRPTGPRDPRLLPLPAAKAAPGTPDRLVWAGGKAADVGPMSEARERAQRAARDEYRRLLYVAMTRAAERLIICGTEGINKKPEGCWYDLVFDALSPVPTEEPADDGDGTVWRYQKSAPDAERPALPPMPSASPIILPDWLLRDAPREMPQSIMISPSSAYDEQRSQHPLPESGKAERSQALTRGRLVHRLMQSLPDIAPERRMKAATDYLARASKEFTAEQCEIVAKQVLAVLDSPRFAALFAPGSRAEVPIVGRLHREGKPPLVVSGQIDRLVVTAKDVLIADYKTNRPVPKKPPEAYVRQLALYRAVLSRLYPGKTVRAALVWTEVPDIMEISGSALDASLANLISSETP